MASCYHGQRQVSWGLGIIYENCTDVFKLPVSSLLLETKKQQIFKSKKLHRGNVIALALFLFYSLTCMTTSYGYRGRDCRSNLYLLPTGETVYFIASVVVLFNVDEQLQRHYTGHTDDIKW